MDKKTEIQMLYDEIPSFTCKEGCCDCCDNYIQYAKEEENRAGGFEFTERMCPHIKDNHCSIYPNRAFICRIYGASVTMSCPHGFSPKQPLSEEKTMELLRKYLKLRKEQEENAISD